MVDVAPSPSPPPQSPPAPLCAADGSPAAAAWALDPTMRHLNHGSFGAVPVAALERQRSLGREMESAPVVWFPALPQRVEGVRLELAPLLQVTADEMALVPNASAGASVVFDAVRLTPGGEVLVTDHGYGAVTMGAARAARRAGARLRTASVDLAADAEQAFQSVWAEVTDRTELLVVDHITSPTARRLPVGRICAEARRRGITTLVDGAHAPMLLPAPAAEAGADFWVGNLHKYACAPRSSAVLVVRPEIAETAYPLIDSWGTELPFPRRFDHQGTLDLTAWLAAPAALGFIADAFGWDRVRRYTDDLASWAQVTVADALGEAFGVDCHADVGMPVGPLRLVRLPSPLGSTPLAANGLRDRLVAETGIEAAFSTFRGDGFLRLSAHAYNTPDDYVDLIERAIPLLVRWSRAAHPEPPTVNPREREEQ